MHLSSVHRHPALILFKGRITVMTLTWAVNFADIWTLAPFQRLTRMSFLSARLFPALFSQPSASFLLPLLVPTRRPVGVAAVLIQLRGQLPYLLLRSF